MTVTRLSLLLLPFLLASACTDAARRSADVVPAGQPVADTTTPEPVVAPAPQPEPPPTTIMSAPSDAGALAYPRVFHDVCQGEGCRVAFPAVACTTLSLHADTTEVSVITAVIRPQDTVQVTHRDLHVVTPGVVRIRRNFWLDWDGATPEERTARADTIRFAEGDSLLLLHYEELGRWSWWFRGRASSSAEFWQGALSALNGGTPVTDASVAEIVSRPAIEEWWRMASASAGSGWWHMGRNGERAAGLDDSGKGESCTSGT